MAIASEGVINYFYAECTEKAKASLTSALTKNLNERISEYTEYANAWWYPRSIYGGI